MFLLVLRTLVVYVLIVAAMRLMGKKQLGELQMCIRDRIQAVRDAAAQFLTGQEGR